jgi:hypothetical protein
MPNKKTRRTQSKKGNQAPKVAIIGSGICGTTSAYYLSSIFSDLEITIFEKNSTVGGRMSTVEIEGKKIELGAGFFIEANRNMMELAKKFECSYKLYEKDVKDSISWDGESVLYNSEVRFSFFRFLYNYGISVFKLKRYLDKSLKDFEKCYQVIDLLNKTHPGLKGPRDFLKVINFEDCLSRTGLRHVTDIGLKENFIKNILYGVVSAIYNNKIHIINSVAIIVTLQGMFRNAYSFTEGNNSLIKKMLTEKNDFCNVKTECEVKEISFNSITKKYNVKYFSQKTMKTEQSEYDVVIMASPFKQSNIKFAGIYLDDSMELTSYNKKVVITVIKGKIRNEFFGLNPNDRPIKSIILAEGSERKLPFVRSFAQIHDLKNGKFLYKLESSEDLKSDILREVFHEHEIIKAHTWDFAYPSLPVLQPSRLIQFRLKKGLFFPGAMEYTSSCMEMQSIAAKNVVKLISEDEGMYWKRK